LTEVLLNSREFKLQVVELLGVELMGVKFQIAESL
jgi:hypothetical protein